MNEDFKGEVSEWNEGNFKSMRLHQAQELINGARIDPLKKTYTPEFGFKWNYLLWFAGIEIMFFEGVQKYSTSEYKESLKLKREIEDLLESKEPIKVSNAPKGSIMVVNNGVWKELKLKLEDFEYKVRHLNDKHGLSTRNMGTKGLF